MKNIFQFQNFAKGKKFILEIFCLSFILLFTSCEKQEIEPIESITFQGLSIELKENVLHFTDGNQFNQFLEKYDNYEEEWKAESKAFTSLEEYINKISETDLDEIARTKDVGKHSNQLAVVKEGDDYFIKPTVDSKILRSLVSQNGNIVIDNTLFHTTYEKTYCIPLENFDETESYEAMATKVIDVQRNRKNIVETRSSIIKEDLFCGGSHWERRMNMELQDYYNGFYTEVSVGLENFKRGLFGVWKKSHADFMSMNGHVTMTFRVDPSPVQNTDTHYISDSNYDTVDLEKKFFNSYSFGTGDIFHIDSWAGTDMDFFIDETNDCSGKQEPTQNGSILVN